MTLDIRDKLVIDDIRLEEINNSIKDPNNKLINDLLEVVEKYGGPEEINRKAREARKLENLMNRLKEKNSQYTKDLEWLIEQKENGAFISVDEYRRKILGDKADNMDFNEITISKEIIRAFETKLLDCIESDVLIAGAGPSGLVAGYYLAKAGIKTTIIEKRLSIDRALPY